jgi:hypothetical protein
VSADRANDDPARRIAFELRQDAGLEQRRFSAARRTDDQRDPWAADVSQSVEGFDRLADLVVATEVDRFVLFFVGE